MTKQIRTNLLLPPSGKTGWPWMEEILPRPPSMPEGSLWPKISIVTPSYNQSQFLEETIRSVLLQGYPNLEYFVMDGGSTDSSVEIIKKYEPWLTYWVSQPDRGQSEAINKGWERSTGDVLAWLNSDDLLNPGVLNEVAQLWLNNSNIGFIHAQTEKIDSEGQPIGSIFGSEFDFIRSLRTTLNCVAQQSTFINRHAVEKVGFLDETLEMSMDWDLWIRIGAQYPTMFVPKIWSKYRIWDNSKGTVLYGLAAEDHLTTVKKITRNKGLRSISRSTKRNAFASAYGSIAYYKYKSGDFYNYRKNILRSLLVDPWLLGGRARHFFLGPGLVKILSKTKRKCLGLS